MECEASAGGIGLGRAAPAGATVDAQGVNFVVVSRHASAVELLLFDDPGAPAPSRSLWLPARSGDRFHGHVPGLGPGQVYAYRVHGDWDPDEGRRFDPSKLLVDPAAHAICGTLAWHPALHSLVDADGRLVAAEDTDRVPRCLVVAPLENGPPARPGIPWSETVLYECQVRSLTARHLEIPPEQRGTYLGLAHDAVLDHLEALGVTSVELMPVQHAFHERHLVERGMANHWGYAPIGFSAPDPRFASGDGGAQVREFRDMVRRLHARGFEVLLDVVYNHSGEGGPDGPTLSLRGIDDRLFYRRAADGRSYDDSTGCGNSLDLGEEAVLEFVLESLRWWYEDCGVDGFRFDLASSLLRGAGGGSSRFGEALAADPVLGRAKLIAEPWDLGPGGYRLGGFPDGWREWNDRYREDLRGFWCGEPGLVARVATRLAGSSDVFAGRGPTAGINYVTSHDGFTLRDLVSYARKHNEPNGEQNRDGPSHERSRNFGVEGPTRDPVIRATRLRVQRSLIASLALSLGVPMLRMGDELGLTQFGNNNPYCQDGSLVHCDWAPEAEDRTLVAFFRKAFALRRAWNGLFGEAFLEPSEAHEPGGSEVRWLGRGGAEMEREDWHRPELRFLGMHRRDPVSGREVLLLLNGGPESLHWPLPPRAGGAWQVVLGSDGTPEGPAADPVEVAGHGFLALALPEAPA